jgi:hypothetical protein
MFHYPTRAMHVLSPLKPPTPSPPSASTAVVVDQAALAQGEC